MIETLEQIKHRFSNGRDYGDFEKEDIDWLIERVEQLEKVKGYLNRHNEALIIENLELKTHPRFRELKELQREIYRLQERNKFLESELGYDKLLKGE